MGETESLDKLEIDFSALKASSAIRREFSCRGRFLSLRDGTAINRKITVMPGI